MSEEISYIEPTKEIYNVAINENHLDWKQFLFKLINRGNLDPWDIDLSKFTILYLTEFKKIEKINFNVAGKFLTIAVYLLKIKAKKLLNEDIVNYGDKIDELENDINDFSDLEDFEDFTDSLEDLQKKWENYKLDFKNPLERKKKVSIYDLVKTLEITLEQSDKRAKNLFQKKEKIEYDGPQFKKNKEDLKQIIEELYLKILEEIGKTQKGHIKFSDIKKDAKSKIDILQKFIPLLYLHNDSKIRLNQKEHFDDFKIHIEEN